MVQSVLPQIKHEGRPSIKKCWKLLKGMIEDYSRLHHELAELESIKREFECSTAIELTSFVKALTAKVKSCTGLR